MVCINNNENNMWYVLTRTMRTMVCINKDNENIMVCINKDNENNMWYVLTRTMRTICGMY